MNPVGQIRGTYIYVAGSVGAAGKQAEVVVHHCKLQIKMQMRCRYYRICRSSTTFINY